jgi:transposase
LVAIDARGLSTQEAPAMLAAPTPRRKPSARDPFRGAPWQDDYPELCRIEADLPEDDHARWIARVVDHLDLGPLRRSYAGSGSLAHPVERLVPFVLWAYSEAILSPAQWAKLARFDDRAKWLLRGLVPSRSRLYSFRDRLGPFLDGWHGQLISWAIAEEITTASRGSLDGSFVAALASRHRLMGVRRVDRRLLLLRLLVWLEGGPGAGGLAARLEALPEQALGGWLLYLELLGRGLEAGQLLEALLGLLALMDFLGPKEGEAWRPRLPAWVPPSPPGRKRVLQRYEEAQQRLAKRLEPYQRKKKLSKKDEQAVKRMKVSLTDPEAALGWDKAGTFRPLYNVLLMQDTESCLTLGWDVLARNNDDGLLKPMVQKTEGQLSRALQEVLADGGFVSVGDVAWCEQQGITVYAPAGKAPASAAPASAAPASAAPAGAEKGAGQQGPAAGPMKLPKQAFRYDGAAGAYVCPEGKRLEEAFRTTEKRQGGLELPVVVHRARPEDCGACPRQEGCTSNPKKGRVVKRYEGEEALERLAQRMQQPHSLEVYRLRCRTVELGYADVKEHRGLRVFRGFGLERARTQAGLVILASNGLKIVAALQRRQSAAQAPSPQEKKPA